MKTLFTKGDSVECVNDDDTSNRLKIGTVYEVVEVVEDADGDLVRIKQDANTCSWYAWRFKLAKTPNPNATQDPRDVHHPAHYSRWPMEPVEFIAINNLPWWLANVIKYTMRFDAKDGLKDLYKARSYLDMKIREIKGEPEFWKKPVSEERRLNKEAA